jgi:hypothetical protein
MDFSFMQASTAAYKKPNKQTVQVVLSYDGYSAYLIIVDGTSRCLWVFLTQSKEPPLDIVRAFMMKFGIGGGCVRTDQGGELARSDQFCNMLQQEFHYVVEPTGSDCPSQNGASEINNDKLAVKVRTLLYGSGLPAKFWSAALVHSVYLHNRLVHSATKMTPYEAWYGRQPDVSNLKMFGSRVCVKAPGQRHCKLDHNDYTGIFLGYTATNQNIRYIDTTTGIVKTSHHATFDEAWYLQPKRPPAAQLLYDLGLEAENTLDTPDQSPTTTTTAPWPPMAPPTALDKRWYITH